MNLLNEVGNHKFMTRKWNIVNDQSNANNGAGNKIFYNSEVLKYNRYSDAYIVVRGDGTDAQINHKAFLHCVSFIKGITTIDDKK